MSWRRPRPASFIPGPELLFYVLVTLGVAGASVAVALWSCT